MENKDQCSTINKFDFNLPLVGGGFFISREQFELDAQHPDAPKGYSYDQYILDSMELPE
jgi:hypothetical protein